VLAQERECVADVRDRMLGRVWTPTLARRVVDRVDDEEIQVNIEDVLHAS
jgi:hypothetical protein